MASLGRTQRSVSRGGATDSSGSGLEAISPPESPSLGQIHPPRHPHISNPSPSPSFAVQKNPRVPRACDECRGKKRKCNAKLPCSRCAILSLECTYDKPSHRRSHPSRSKEVLEKRLAKAEKLLNVLVPGLRIEDLDFDTDGNVEMSTAIQRAKLSLATSYPELAMDPLTYVPRHTLLTPSVDAVGYDFSFMSNSDTVGLMGVDSATHPDRHQTPSSALHFNSPHERLNSFESLSPSSWSWPVVQLLLDSRQTEPKIPKNTFTGVESLPSRDIARSLCQSALEDGCCLIRFVHEPSFYSMLDRVYDTHPYDYTRKDKSFLCLLFLVMSVGCLFSSGRIGTFDLSCYEGSITQGSIFFHTGRQLFDSTESSDMISLQTICFMVIFLQGSARLGECYSYIGMALRSVLRLGLHRRLPVSSSKADQELWKRLFWAIRKMDIHLSTLLGLPRMLDDHELDQDYLWSTYGDSVSSIQTQTMPSDQSSLMAGVNAHTRLSKIFLKMLKSLFYAKGSTLGFQSEQGHLTIRSRIFEIEHDLQKWTADLPFWLHPDVLVGRQLEKVRLLVRISYAHVQMIMYRPFLSYVADNWPTSSQYFHICAAACVSVCRNIIHMATEMHKRQQLNGSYSFTIYTIYIAIMSLIYFLKAPFETATSKDDVLKDIFDGRTMLERMGKKNITAHQCSRSLDHIFQGLPELLSESQFASRVDIEEKDSESAFGHFMSIQNAV